MLQPNQCSSLHGFHSNIQTTRERETPAIWRYPGLECKALEENQGIQWTSSTLSSSIEGGNEKQGNVSPP